MSALCGFHHVKLPVSDVGLSRDWYQTVLGLTVDIEFMEDGVLMGVALRDPTGTVSLAARHDPERAAALAGFDPIAVGVPSRTELEGWVRRLDVLGQPHSGIVPGHEGWALIGLHDPDGIEVRLYTIERHDEGTAT